MKSTLKLGENKKLIVGELINSSRKIIRDSIENRDNSYIRNIAKQQVEAGANYLDVNCCEVLKDEMDAMRWLIDTIFEVVDVPLCIDTPNPEVMELGLSLARNGKSLVNSLTGEKERYLVMLPLALKYNAAVCALSMDDQGVSDTTHDRLRVTRKLVNDLTRDGMDLSDIYLDLLVQPVATKDRNGVEMLEAVRIVKKEFPDIHVICGLSNISYGLPNRKILNRVFMIQAMTMGVSAFILDPLDRVLMGYLYASQALLGRDEFCKSYLNAHRKGLYGD